MTGLTHRLVGVAERAERCLRGTSYLALRNVRCEDRDGVLTLSGRLPSYYLKQVAQTLVGQVEGVRRIDNRIEVVGPVTAVSMV